MQGIAGIPAVFDGLKLAYDEVLPGRWVAGLRLGQLVVAHVPNGLRLEVQMLTNVVRNKVSVWNVVHQNNQPAPFGQYYLSPEGAVCLGLVLPPDHRLLSHLPLVVQELVRAAEAHGRQIHAEFAELPWDEQDVRANLLHLLRTEFPASQEPLLALTDAAPSVAGVLSEAFGANQVVAVSSAEWGMPVGDFVTHVSLHPLPFIRQDKGQPDWALHIQTEIGSLAASDERLWLALNRYNHQAAGVAVAVRYGQRKPILRLHSELPAHLLGLAPELIVAGIQDHAAVATQLLSQWKDTYRITGVLHTSLGI